MLFKIKKMEPIIAIVGFLGAGKTTLLRHLTNSFISEKWNPYVILNDYENAHLDAQQLAKKIDPKHIQALNGSCICCSGIAELRDYVNRIPLRENGITLIEANGTSDACSLMGFLGVGLENRYLPPVQISVVDVKNWQRRGEHNELESNQIQVSSVIVLTHLEGSTDARIKEVKISVKSINPYVEIISLDELNIYLLPKLVPSKNTPEKLDHLKAHWASCSIELPDFPNEECIKAILNKLPKSILRVKGVTKIGNNENYTFFERIPDGTINIRKFRNYPTTGPMLLSVGPGSEPGTLLKALNAVI